MSSSGDPIADAVVQIIEDLVVSGVHLLDPATRTQTIRDAVDAQRAQWAALSAQLASQRADEIAAAHRVTPESAVRAVIPSTLIAPARLGITSDRAKVDATIEPATGMQRSYLVLSDEERAKGFVRPVRQTYVHVGNGGPKGQTRDLTDEERERYAGQDIALFEQYDESQAPATGRYWTNADLARATACGTATTMGRALAETYAREPKFYSGTFCSRCRAHFPVGADGEFVWEDTSERVGT